MTEEREELFEEQIVRCINCKYFNLKTRKCDFEPKPFKAEDKLDSCVNGSFEKIDVALMLREIYKEIIEIIDYYMDIPENLQTILALWIIGTHFHENFNTYPYLFINAMRGSGKTRLLKIISLLAKDGLLLNSITDAVLFRTKGTLIIDEFEGVGSKDKSSLRELLNSGYKKGARIFRMRKKKTLDGEEQVVEEFNTYRPIAMANIWGMEEVLGDRCITMLLEKSGDSKKTKLVENFDDISNIPKIQTALNSLVSAVWCWCSLTKNIYVEWNKYIKETTYNTPTTYTTLNYTNYTNINFDNNFNAKINVPLQNFEPLFKKIMETEIDGRNLELFLPLFMIAGELNDEKILNKVIEYAKFLVKEKKVEEATESKDVLLYSFIAKEDEREWKSVKELSATFKLIVGEECDWLNVWWFGKALKRLNLILEKKRLYSGTQVILNVEKAKEKAKMFE